jgi:hypothetical protein
MTVATCHSETMDSAKMVSLLHCVGDQSLQVTVGDSAIAAVASNSQPHFQLACQLLPGVSLGT